MNMPLVLLNRRRRGGAAAFTPAGLFALAEPGVWYDPSDVANLAWRRNLLTFTEQFDNAAWVKTNTSATANTITVASNANNIVYAPASGVAVSAGTVTSSCEFKAGTASFVTLAVWKGNNPPGHTGALVWVDLQNGQIGSSRASAGFAVVSSGVVPVGDGWFRAWVTATVPSDTIFHEIRAVDSDNTFNVTAVSGKTILARKAQLEIGTLTDYQRISDVNTEVIERFPSATLYQDTAGTLPVTTPGQTVALALDKSKGLVLGSELVTNGTFDANVTGWTGAISGTISWVSGVARVANSVASSGRATAPITTIVGRGYLMTAGVVIPNNGQTVSVGVSNNSDGTSAFATRTGSGNLFFIATATTTYVALYVGTSVSGNSADFDNISVKELPGFHATQATLASRPTYGIVPLGGRRNLLLNTDTLATQNVTVTAVSHVLSFTGTGTITLSGVSTAGPLVGTGVNDRVSLTFTPTAGTLTLTVSGSVKFAQLERA